MWSQKKRDTPQAAAPEPKNLLTNKKSTDVMRPLDATVERATGWLGSSLRVKGTITGTEDLLIDGSVEGLIQLDEWKLTVGTTAKLTADINARDVVVYGYVKGNVRATGRIEIKKDGSVIGNLTTAQILIEDGADFRGTIEIDRSATKEGDTNVSLRAASAAAGAGPKSI
jgi:cytoskeletal protein CcmA (bactofilin family)